LHGGWDDEYRQAASGLADDDELGDLGGRWIVARCGDAEAARLEASMSRSSESQSTRERYALHSCRSALADALQTRLVLHLSQQKDTNSSEMRCGERQTSMAPSEQERSFKYMLARDGSWRHALHSR
jgi:hypothetical protein